MFIKKEEYYKIMERMVQLENRNCAYEKILKDMTMNKVVYRLDRFPGGVFLPKNTYDSFCKERDSLLAKEERLQTELLDTKAERDYYKMEYGKYRSIKSI